MKEEQFTALGVISVTLWSAVALVATFGGFGPQEDFIDNIILLRGDIYQICQIILLTSILIYAVRVNKKQL